MSEIIVYHVDVFTTETFGGNTAGVVLDGEKLTEDEIQSIANEFILSESVLPLPSYQLYLDTRGFFDE
ncbi:PhzF family phenazine biosynthesis protein [Bacillus sp. NPDC077027]|uniref:PhzF family phenazine biosynthesis protein n=1 Tax=Bacillus sp. NPDC077027 TaxID=3390548 RepID=UPI003D0866C7